MVIQRNLSDWAAVLADVELITGRLLVSSFEGRLSLAFEALQTALSVEVQESRGVVDLSFPALTAIPGELKLTSSAQVLLHAPLLASIGSSLRIFGVDEIAGLALPRLTDVGRDVRVSASGSSSPELAMPMLAHVGGELTVQQVAGVARVEWPLLESVGQTLHVQDNPALRVLSFERLTSVGDGVVITHNALRRIALPALHDVGAAAEVLVIEDDPCVAAEGRALAARLAPALRGASSARAPLDCSVP